MIAAAHAVGVTHGDLHPGDVVITSHGLVKVLDLEMRAALGERSAAERETRDVIGLGALLYASLTGRWPLGAGRGLPAAELDSNGACRSPRQLRAGVPRELDALAMAALGTAATRRPVDTAGRSGPPRPRPTAAEMVDALQGIVASCPPARSPPWTTTRRPTPRPSGRPRQPRPNGSPARPKRRRRTIRRRVLPVALLVVLALAAWLIGVAVGGCPAIPDGAPAAGTSASRAPPASRLTWRPSSTSTPRRATAPKTRRGVPLATTTTSATAWSTEIYYGSQWGGTRQVRRRPQGRPRQARERSPQVRLLFQQAGRRSRTALCDADSASLDAYTVAADLAPNPGTTRS